MWNRKQIFRRILLGAAAAAVAVAALYAAVPRPGTVGKIYLLHSRLLDRNGRLLHLGLSMDDKYRLRVSYRQIPPEAVKALLLL